MAAVVRVLESWVEMDRAGAPSRLGRSSTPAPRLARLSEPPADLSVIVPTYNERDNIEELLERIRAALDNCRWEVIIVDDDSPDKTYEAALAIARRDRRVRVIRRLGRRGLSSACIEGILSSSARFVAVIDADLQHDPALLCAMFALLRTGQADVVVGSRYTAGGGLGSWSGFRARLSRAATWIARTMAQVELNDPLSGFFALRRDIVDRCAHRLSGAGFKILLDILLSAPHPLRAIELPFTFGLRVRGQSKLSTAVMWECASLLLRKALTRRKMRVG